MKVRTHILTLALAFAMIVSQLPLGVFAGIERESRSVYLLPEWFTVDNTGFGSQAISEMVRETQRLDIDGVTFDLPIGIPGFSIHIVPTDKSTEDISVTIASNDELMSYVADAARDDVEFIGRPFRIIPRDADTGRLVDKFGLREVKNEDGQIEYASTISVSIRYDDSIFRPLNVEEKSYNIAVYAYDPSINYWRQLVSLADVDSNTLFAYIHTAMSNLFAIGISLDGLPTIMLDPDSSVANVSGQTFNGRWFRDIREGELNVDTALNIKQYIESMSQECGVVVTVSLTHQDPYANGDTISTRGRKILDTHPDVAVTIAYDSHSSSMDWGTGGMKALFKPVGRNRDLATQVIARMRGFYNHTHGNSSGLYPYPYYIGSYRMKASVEKYVADRDSSIPMTRIEVGVLSLYQNRVAIDDDFDLPPGKRQIAVTLAQALMGFIKLKIGCLECGATDEFQVRNGRYFNTKAGECVFKHLMDPEPLDRDAVFNVKWLDDMPDLCGLRVGTIISSNPPMPVFVENMQPSEMISLQRNISIALPTNYIIAAIALEAMGDVTEVVFADYHQYQELANNITISEAEIISTALSVGTCHGLMAWLARYCADMEPLESLGVDSVSDLSTSNQEFMERVLWYQIIQLTKQYSNSIRAWTPISMYRVLSDTGSRDPTLPRIATFIPDTDIVDCGQGSIPSGHTLFVVGASSYDGNPIFSVFDPNTGESFPIYIDPDTNKWIYRDAPYPATDGSRKWVGSVIYAVAPGDLPRYSSSWWEEPPDFIDWEDIMSYGGYHLWSLGGFHIWSLGGASHVDSSGCISITRSMAGRDRVFLPGLRRYKDEPRTFVLYGTRNGANVAAETMIGRSGTIVLVGEATTETIDVVGVYTSLRGITMTTNMSEKHQGVAIYRVVDNGRTNRLFNVRDIIVRQGETINIHASPHNNLFVIDNREADSNSVDLTLATIGRPGVTVFSTDSLSVSMGHVVTFTAWNWDNISDSLLFEYDWNGYTTTVSLLQDATRPTKIVFGKPSYLSGSVTYLTPDTLVSFDVMPATCGVSATLYRLDSGEYHVYTHPFVLEGVGDGSHIIEYYSVDNAGNVEPVNSAQVYVYTQPPEVAIVLTGQLGHDGWYTPPVTVSLQMTQTVLPIDEEGSTCRVYPGTVRDYQGPFAVDENATKVACEIRDLAGLSSQSSMRLPIRSEHASGIHGLGDSTLSEATRQSNYQKVFEDVYEYPGTVLQSLGEALCSGLPMEAGDLLVLEKPYLGNPLVYDPECVGEKMRAEYGAAIGVLSSVVSDTRAVWEFPVILQFLEDYLGLGDENLTTLNEDDIRGGELSQVSVLIIPSVYPTYVLSITEQLGSDGLANIRAFVRNGGYIYASGGTAAVILSAAGVISGNVVSDTNIVATDNIALVSVSSESPLGLNWVTSTVYVPNGDYVLMSAGNLTPSVVYSDTNYPGSPAVLRGRYGNGSVVIANHHPLVPANPIWYPFVIDVLLDAMSAPAALLAQGQQIYDPVAPYDLLPAYESEVPISISIGIDFLDPVTGTLVGLTVTLSPGFYVKADENPGWRVIAGASVMPTGTLMVPTGTKAVLLISGTQSLGSGRYLYSLLVRTSSTDTLNAGEVQVGSVTATIVDGLAHKYEVTGAPVVMYSAATPYVMWYARLIREIFTGVSGREQDDSYTDVFVGMANLRDREAYETVYTTAIPLLSPVLDVMMEDVVTDARGDSVWLYVYPTFNTLPLPEQAWYRGQRFNLYDWDGHTVMTLTLPPDSPINLPLSLTGDGCDGVQGNPCCNGSGMGSKVGLIRTPTSTLVVLPAMKFTWRLGDVNGYEYKDPIVRYRLYVKEWTGKEVRFRSNYDPYDPSIISDTEAVYLQSNGAIWVGGGRAPLAFNGDEVSSTPSSSVRLSASASDLWGREHNYEDWAKRILLIAPSFGTADGEGASVLNITSEAIGDTNGDGVLEQLTDIPADRPVTVCLHTTIVDYGRQEGKTGVLLLRIPLGLGYVVEPLYRDWMEASQSENGYAVYSDTKVVDGEYWVMYKVALPEMETERLTTCLTLSPYPGISHEGYRTFLNGAFYYYPNETGGAWPYELESMFVQAAWAIAHDIQVTPHVKPWYIGRGVSDFIYAIEVEDTEEPHQVYPAIYVATYGSDGYAGTVYVGGSTSNGELLDTILQDDDDMAIIRVEVHNSTGLEWTNVTVTATYPGLIVEPYWPSSSDVMALSEHPHLWLENLSGVSWGVYYFTVRLDPTHSITPGSMLQVPVIITGDGLSADIPMPAARIGVAEEQHNWVEDVLGQARGVVVSAWISDGVTLSDPRIAPSEESTRLLLADDDEANQIFTSLMTVPMSTMTGTGGSWVRVSYPPASNTLPADGGPYVVLWRGHAGPLSHLQQELVVDQSPTVEFTNTFGVSESVHADPVVLPVGGPVIEVVYLGLPSHVAVVSSTIQAVAYNRGDYAALEPTVRLTIPASVEVIPLSLCQPPVRIGESQIVTCELNDIVPGGSDAESIRFIVTQGDRWPALPNVLVEGGQAQYVNSFTGRPEVSPLQAAVIPYGVYLPLIMREYSPPKPDLTIVDISWYPDAPVVGTTTTLTVVIQNIGVADVLQPFWVDLYISPTQVPTVNLPFNEASEDGYGMAWEVTSPLPMRPGQQITLTSEQVPEGFSRWPGHFPQDGEIVIYALVDSYDDPDRVDHHGNVWESNEGNNLYRVVVYVGPDDTGQVEHMRVNLLPGWAKREN